MSWQDTLIVTGSQVRAVTGRAKGVEDRKLAPAIHFAQHALEEILGVTLYAQLEAAYLVTPETMDGEDMLALYTQHCVPFLSWKTMEEAYPDLHSEADRNGVFSKSGEDYAAVGSSTLSMLMRVAGSRAEKHQAMLLRYLRALASDNVVRLAFAESVSGEPRTIRTYRASVPTKRSGWQNRYDQYDTGIYNGCHDES